MNLRSFDSLHGGGGLAEDVEPVMVVGDGTIAAGTDPQTKELNGGFAIVDVPSRDAAVTWAAKRPPAAVHKRCASSCPTHRLATDCQLGCLQSRGFRIERSPAPAFGNVP
jgi:YCII-related domain